MRFHQCTLVRSVGQGWAETTSYLPEKWAQVGRQLALKKSDGDWTYGWEVTLVGPPVSDPPKWKEDVEQYRRAKQGLPSSVQRCFCCFS